MDEHERLHNEIVELEKALESPKIPLKRKHQIVIEMAKFLGVKEGVTLQAISEIERILTKEGISAAIRREELRAMEAIFIAGYKKTMKEMHAAMMSDARLKKWFRHLVVEKRKEINAERRKIAKQAKKAAILRERKAKAERQKMLRRMRRGRR